MVPITEEERNGPLYKYFMRDMVEPDPAKYAQTQEPVDFPEEESALHLDNLFEPGYMPVELGYGYLPDGCAILANLTEFPGATVEMFDFWFAWHPIESMRYKIWNRDQHYYCQTMNEFYGTIFKWRLIYEANYDSMKGTDMIYVGQVLQIP